MANDRDQLVAALDQLLVLMGEHGGYGTTEAVELRGTCVALGSRLGLGISLTDLTRAQTPNRELAQYVGAGLDLERRLRTLRAAAAATIEPAAPPVGHTKAVEAAPLPDLLSAADIAKALGLDANLVETRLRRLRKKRPDCYTENEARRRNEPRYLYRTADVLPHLEPGA